MKDDNVQAAELMRRLESAGLTTSVRTSLSQVENAPLASGQRRYVAAALSTGIAEYLIERRAVLDRTLQRQDGSALSTILRRTPPLPAALVMIDVPAVRERFTKLLRNANVEIDEADADSVALTRLEQHVHAVMFTDRIELIAARHLPAGAATHVVFVNDANAADTVEATCAQELTPDAG